ncbi:MAG: hypothetical protein ACLRVB_06710 [Blautia sp.]
MMGPQGPTGPRGITGAQGPAGLQESKELWDRRDPLVHKDYKV